MSEKTNELLGFFCAGWCCRSCECLGEEWLNLTAHVCTGEDVRTGDTFVTCGGEQPDVTTRALHDTYNNNKKKITGGRLKECKHARGDTCPKHTHIHTQIFFFFGVRHTQAELLQQCFLSSH